jgi:hypothetical protein
VGFIGRLKVALGVLRTQSGVLSRGFKVDPGGGATITVSQFGTPGDDSAPLDTDIPVLVSLKRSGSGAIVGFIDPKNAPAVGKGERKLYARDAGGAIKGWIKLSADGAIRFENSSGSVLLAPSGTITLNGLVTIDTSGNITTPGNITATGTIHGAGITDTTTNVTLGTHKHPGNNTAPTPGT